MMKLIFLNIKNLVRLFVMMALGLPGYSFSQEQFPSKMITLVIGFTAGSSSDVFGRFYAKKLSSLTGQAVVVENRLGAAGLVGANSVLRAPANGYTLMATTASLPITAYMQNEHKLDVARDFVGIVPLFKTSLVVIVKADSSLKTLSDLIDVTKKSPRGLSYATFGVGSFSHLQMEMLSSRSGGAKIIHIPYKGGPEVTSAVLSGEVDVGLAIALTVASQVKSGQLRALVTFDNDRTPVLPNVPSIKEVGYPDVTVRSYVGIVASAKTPPVLVSRLQELSQQVVADPEYIEAIAKYGADPLILSSAEWNMLLLQESEKVFGLTKSMGLIKSDALR